MIQSSRFQSLPGKLFFFLILLTSAAPLTSLSAASLTLNLNFSVANAPAEKEQIPLIPSSFSLQRKREPGSSENITFTDSTHLNSPFQEIYSEKWQASPSEDGLSRNENPQIKNYSITIPNFSSLANASDLFLRGSFYDLFMTPALIQTAFLVEDLCQIQGEKAECETVFPSIQVAELPLENITAVRLKVFRKAQQIDGNNLNNLPAGAISDKQRRLDDCSRERVEHRDPYELSGYFLVGIYHFDAGLTARVDEAIPNDAGYEWRYALSQAFGRLPLIAGDYYFEREIIDAASGVTKIEAAKQSLSWKPENGKKFFSVQDLQYQQVIPEAESH